MKFDQQLDRAFEVDFKTYDLVGKIQVRQTGPLTYEQRHIWIKAIVEPHTEDWIPSLKCCYEDIRVRGKEVTI